MQRSKNLFASFEFAIQGLKTAFAYNLNIRIHVLIAVAVLFLSYLFRITPAQLFMVGVLIVLVISAEMINTVIEEMANLITKEHHEEVRIAKDVSAGMVLLVSILAAIVGITIFLPYLSKLF